MLVFFIHGVATRDVKYSQALIEGIKDELSRQSSKLPYFYTSFWGHVLNDFNQIWNHISDDLNMLKRKNPAVDIKDVFRYRQFREGLISEFVGDMFTYMNESQGFEIRKILAEQLTSFIDKYPDEKEIHIISHSLGTVILWDILFSDNFADGDPAFAIRNCFSNQPDGPNSRRVSLASITTMGSPILFFNAMLGINSQDIKTRVQDYTSRSLKWLNFIHASDIIAYPLGASLGIDGDNNRLSFRDHFIYQHANLLETAALKANQQEIALAASMMDAHTSYWSSTTVIRLISELLISENSIAKQVVRLLKRVPGLSPTWEVQIHINEKTIEVIRFRDSSGRLKCTKNFANVHHVYVYDARANRIFSGYVDWLRTDALLDEIEHIKHEFGKR